VQVPSWPYLAEEFAETESARARFKKSNGAGIYPRPAQSSRPAWGFPPLASYRNSHLLLKVLGLEEADLPRIL